jgi:hypothetical protein
MYIQNQNRRIIKELKEYAEQLEKAAIALKSETAHLRADVQLMFKKGRSKEIL